MTTDPLVDPYLDSLRGARPTSSDEVRIARKLSAAGIVLSMSSMTQVAAASTTVTTGLAKGSLLSLTAARLLKLPVLAQMGLVTATTTLLATGPVVVVLNHYEVGTHHGQSRVTAAALPSRPVPTAINSTQTERSAEQRLTGAMAPVTAADNDQSRHSPPIPKRQRVQSEALNPQDPELRESSLSEETRLMDASLGAIRQGHLTLAEQLLRSHAERFPNGRLTLERLRAEQKLRAAREQDGL